LRLLSLYYNSRLTHLVHTSSTTLSLLAKKPTHFLLWTGRQLRQPLLARGPYAMNTESQIAEAFVDYSAGLFGFIPA